MKKFLSLAVIVSAMTAFVGCDDKKTSAAAVKATPTAVPVPVPPVK